MKKYSLIFFLLFFSKISFADEKMILGLEVYNNKAMCGTCHTLKSAESNGEIGPSLDILKPQISQVINAVTNGIGVMPAWEGILTPKEIESVAYFVFKSTNECK
jgi:mono/diheme cytochrome c family protein